MKFKGLSLIVLSSFAGGGYAAGFQINELSPTIQAAALADAATASGDISGMAYNPATLATVDGPTVYAGGSVIIPKVGYDNAVGSIPVDPFSVGTVTSESNIAPTAVVPAIYLGDNVNKFHFGLGVNAPFGLTSNYDANWVGQDNALQSEIQTVQIAPTVAYAFNSNFTVGASLDVTYANAIYSNNFNSTVLAVSGTTRLAGHSWGEGYTVGAMYKPTSTTTLGADYHSKQDENIDGTDVTTFDIAGNPVVSISPNGSAVIDLPQVVNLGVAQQLTDKITVMAGGQWTGWSSMQTIDANIATLGNNVTPLNWRDTWLYSLGGSYQMTPRWKFLGGMAYDATPTNNTDRDPRIPDSNRWWLTTGFVYAPSKNLALNLTYEHLFMANQTVSVTQQASPLVEPSTIYANYSGCANIIAGSFRYTF